MTEEEIKELAKISSLMIVGRYSHLQCTNHTSIDRLEPVQQYARTVGVDRLIKLGKFVSPE